MADDYTFHVDRTSILLFASALGETNRIYYDDAFAAGTSLGGVIAPPTFPIAASIWDPTYVLRGVRKIPEPPPRRQPGGGGSSGSVSRGLHAEQRFRWHQPMRPGMKLTVSRRPGRAWTKQGRRGGTLEFGESVTEYRDEEGALVCTATSVGVQTSKAVEGTQ